MKHLYFSLKILTVVFIATLLLTGQGAKAQTLARGDIAFVRVNESTIDGFSFVALVTIPAGTQIYFTDNSWGNNGWTNAEAHFLYTAPAAGLNPGTVVHCDETSANTFTVTGGGGTLIFQDTGTGGFSIAGGDQIIAYQSTTGVKPAVPNFIAAINTDDGGGVQMSTPPYTVYANDATGWVTDANWALSSGSSSQGSTLPNDLTNGTDAVGMFPQSGAYVNSEQDNMHYDCSKGTNGTKAALLALINNRANWVFNANTDFPSNTVCSFTVSSGAPTITSNPSNRTICLNGTTTMSVVATGSPTYKWQVNTGSGFTDITGAPYSNFTTNTLTISSATAAMSGYQYQCVVTNVGGNATSGIATLTVNSVMGTISKTDVSCNGGGNGTATVVASGGTTPYTYSWAPSGGSNATATGLMAGTYTCTITDNLGCTKQLSIAVGQPAASLGGTTAKTDVSCNGGSNGTATVSATGGTTPYFYSWAPSGGTNATATGRAAGTYTVTVTDFNGCQITRTVTINQPAALSAATGGGKTDVSCNGGANGTATVAPTGGTSPYSYSWAPSGGTNATATGLTAGTYTVTVTDFNGCQTTRAFTINQPAAALGATISKTDVSCNGGGNGTATVAVTGGTTSYTYSWAPSGGTNATATGLSTGTYTVTVTDANACQITRTVTINQPAAALSLAYGGSSSITKDAAFSYTFAATGGTPGYTYSTTGTRPNGLNLSNSGVLSGTPTVTGTFIFNVIATDANSCTTSIPVSITVADPLPVTLTDFTTKPVSGGVEVSWNTVSETNSSHFELMHATENGKFSLISRQEAMGNSGTGKRYSFLHRQPANGNNYYQLLQLDKNGDSKDYGVKTVYFNSVTKDGVSLYPNPAAHTVTVTFATKTYSQLQVTDMLGKVVRSQKIGSADTEQRISVETLPTGTYTIILTAEGKRSVHKLIKL